MMSPVSQQRFFLYVFHTILGDGVSTRHHDVFLMH